MPRCVSLDGYTRVGKGGLVSPLAGYEFVVPARGALVKKVEGTATRLSCVRRKGASKFLRLHPRKSRSDSDLHYWSMCVQLDGPKGSYTDHICYSRVAAWALGLAAADLGLGAVDDATWARESICHHKFSVRVSWRGSRIWVRGQNANFYIKTQKFDGILVFSWPFRCLQK